MTSQGIAFIQEGDEFLRSKYSNCNNWDTAGNSYNAPITVNQIDWSLKAKNIQIFNLSNEDWIDVISIAKIVCKLMNVDDSIIELSGGTKDGRGWVGDVKKMRLGIDKIKSEGWDLSLNSEKAIKKACSEIISDLKIEKN